MVLFTIFDRLAEECGPVYHAKNDAMAVREFKKAFAKQPAGFADEYWLYCIGVLDESSMVIATEGCPRRVVISYEELKERGGL